MEESKRKRDEELWVMIISGFFFLQCYPVLVVFLISVIVHFGKLKSVLLKVFNFFALPKNTCMPLIRVQSGNTGNKDYDGGLLALACTFPISLLNE